MKGPSHDLRSGWSLTVQFDDSEEPVSLIPSGQDFAPYTRNVYDKGEFRYLDGTVCRGRWDSDEETWSKITVKGKFYNAKGEEFTPTAEQLEFYHAQGMALLAPLRDFAPNKTAEELRNGPCVPRSLEEFRTRSGDAAESKNEPDRAMEKLELGKNIYDQEDYTEVMKTIQDVYLKKIGPITLLRIFDVLGDEFKESWKHLPNKQIRENQLIGCAKTIFDRLSKGGNA